MAIFDDLKSVAGVLRKADKIEEYQKILEIQGKLLELQKRNTDLESENKNLKEKLTIKGSLKYDRNAYWDDQGGGPFCSRCWESDKQLIRMQPLGNPEYFSCPNCTNNSVNVYGESKRRANIFIPDSSR